jgi:hypothetical protein
LPLRLSDIQRLDVSRLETARDCRWSVRFRSIP